MDPFLQHLTCIKQCIVWAVLFSVSQAKRCRYRFYAPKRRSHTYAMRHHEPTETGVKDCTWGCCWDQTYDVCCPFPMEIVVVGVISFVAIIIVIAVVVSLVKYFLSKWRTCIHGHTSACRHDSGNFTTLVYPCQSTILHQNYIQLDQETPSPYTNRGLYLDRVPVSKSHEDIAKNTEKFSHLIYGTL